MKSKILYSIILVLSVASAGGCITAPPRDPAQEIVMHKWSPEGKEGETRGELLFCDDEMLFSAKMSDTEVRLRGEYLIDDKTITVMSEQYGTVCMDYELSSEYLTLSYYGRSAKFVKK